MRRIAPFLLAAGILLAGAPCFAADAPPPPGTDNGAGRDSLPLSSPLKERIGKLPIPGLPGLEGALSDNVPLRVEADHLAYDDDTGVAVADGNVEVTFGEHMFRAHAIRYDTSTGEAVLDGDVKFGGPEGSFAFDRVTLSVPEGTGVLDNGVIDLGAGNYRISSHRFEKTGDKTFLVRSGSFTTCPCDPVPDWSLAAEKLDVAIDGYAVGRNVVFRVRDYPVLWLPWGFFPAKVTRQSGLLLPVVGQSGTKGASLTLPLYWAINRWSDATLTVEGMTKRGIRPEGEYRFVLNPRSEGVAAGSWFHDLDSGADLWRAWGKTLLRSSDRLALSAKWDTGSGGRYYRDFAEEDLLRTSRHVASRGFVEDRGENDVRALSFETARETQLPETPGRTSERLPEATERILPRVLPGGFDLRGDAAAVRITRGTADNTTGADGEYRARAFIELSRPTRLGPYATVTPFAFAEGAASRPTGADNGVAWPWRVVPGAGATLSTSLFREKPRPAGHRYVHSVRPSVSYRWVPAVRQSDLPVSDEWSRLSGRSRFTLDVSQSLHRIGAGEKDPRELLSVEAEWSYDVGSLKRSDSPYLDPLSPFSVALRDEIDAIAGRDRRARKASDILLQGGMHPYPGHALVGEILFDPVERTLTHAAGGYEYGKKGRNRARIEYRTTRGISEEVKGLFSWKVLSFLRLGAEADYSIRTGTLTEGNGQLLYLPKSGCWNLGAVVRRTSLPSDTSVKVVFSLLGLGGTAEVD